MKKADYIVKIDHPCSQDWHAMESSKQGKYCSHCSKHLVDFSLMSDQQILNYIEKNQQQICGRLNQSQMNRVLVAHKKQSPPSYLYKLLTGFLFLLTAGNTSAKEKKIDTQIISTLLDHTSDKENIANSLIPSDSLINYIEGTVTNHYQEKLLQAIIRIKGTSTIAMSDIDGKYLLPIPEYLLEDTVFFEVIYIGYETQEFFFKSVDLPSKKDIVLNSDAISIVGEIKITEEHKRKKKKR